MEENKDVPIEAVFKCLYKQHRNLQVKFGKEKAYNEELEIYIHELERKLYTKKQVEDEEKKRKELMQPSKEECRQFRKEIKEQEMYRTLKERYDRLHKQYREVSKVRDELINKNIILENKLKKQEGQS